VHTVGEANIIVQVTTVSHNVYHYSNHRPKNDNGKMHFTLSLVFLFMRIGKAESYQDAK